MLKKSLVIMSISAAFFAQAQDISIIRNSIDVYSNSPMVGSSKFNAMGGANGALGGDANSLLTNPAGLGVAIAGGVSGTLSIMGNKNTSSLAGSSASYSNTKGDIGNVGGVMTFQLLTSSAWKFINVGVNFSNQSLDNYVESPGNSNIIYDFPNSTNSSSYDRHAYNRYGNLSKTSFGVGANYNHSLYIGAGLNFLNASLDQSDTASFRSLNSNSTELFSKNGTPYYERSNGFSASLGVIGKLGPNFRLGASVETPTFWNIDKSYNFYNDPKYGDDVGFESNKFRSPLKATVSAAFVATKNFSIDVDYTLGLTKPKYKVYTQTEVDINNFFKDNSKNLSELRVGAEYRVKQVRLRGGYSYASSPFDALTIGRFTDAGTQDERSYDNLILNNRNALSFGIGYDFKSFYIDAAYQNITSKYSNPFMFGVLDDSTNSAYYSANRTITSDSFIVSDVKNIRNNFFLTFGWKF
ncbi:OmpP1/FadL family transporter [Chryseobacterium sp. ERMR1:04]|uniref:OmpP1/FadL family transporter n=1 Tax=Chryseobacterium sp. ERMR1:04 TaxID=1705393 RepID=UPI0006C88E56|nr:hemin receptor [Chryseobacterium sp. ERMR1:04]KPH13495.1 hemin receptor [Chryseobacterium sp. ERMR1:04]